MKKKQNSKRLSLFLVSILLFSVFAGYIPTSVHANELDSPVVNEDGTVSFYYQDAGGEADQVRVAGSFTDWQNNALSMEKSDVGNWTTTTNLTAGIYQYKFIIGESNWILDPLNEEQDGGNSKLVVPGINLDLVPSKIEVGSEQTLKANVVEGSGVVTETSDVTWSLEDAPKGIQLSGSNLQVTSEATADQSFTVKAVKGDYVATKQVQIISGMTDFTINYYREDPESLTQWDMHIFNGAGAFESGDYDFDTIEGTDYKFAKGTYSFPTNEITVITRPGAWGTEQGPEQTITVPENENATEVWLVEGSTQVFTSRQAAIDEITGVAPETEERRVRFVYERQDQDYTDWNIWVWGTGAIDGQIDFKEEKDGKAIATIPVSPNAEEIGFKLRKGETWDTVDVDIDRSIQLNENDLLTKVQVTSGKEAFKTVPEVNGPVINNGDVTFYYRDKELYASDDMDQIESVLLNINGQQYEMTYEEVNERFIYEYANIPEGEHDYTFTVTKGEETTEVSDPYHTIDGVSTVSYSIPELTVDASVAPQAIDYNQNAVLSLDIQNTDEVEIRELYADLTAVGGSDKAEIDPALNALTIAVDQSITAGTKTIPVYAVDTYGNKHEGEATVTVKTREVADDEDFDWDEARIYFMLTDRFFDGDSSNNDPYNLNYDTSKSGTYHGGDFEGITEKLDYLAQLGINTIWINPIVENIKYDVRFGAEDGIEDQPYYAYHGYWASDFTKLNPHFGTMDEFHDLIDEAHERGIKIMVDVVLNHSGYGMKEVDGKISEQPPGYPTAEDRSLFKDMLRQGLNVGSDTVVGELAGLPDFKTEEAEVREQLVEWQTNWLKEAKTENGNTIDYFRVDTVKHVDDTTWQAFKNSLTDVKPDFKMIGEAFGAGLSDDQGFLDNGTMDSILDFEFKEYAKDFANGELDSVETILQERNEFLSNTATLGQFLGSHDEEGFLVSVDNDEGKLKLAAALQITAKGQPVIYYGEELGQSGLNNYPYLDNRYDYAWDDVEGNDILAHYTALLNARADYSDVFSKGTRTKVAGSDEEGYLAFARTYEGESVVVGLNVEADNKQVTVEVPFSPNTNVKDVYSGNAYTVSADQTVTLTIPSKDDGGTVILAADEKETESSEDAPKESENNEKDKENTTDDKQKQDEKEKTGKDKQKQEDKASKEKELRGSLKDGKVTFESEKLEERGTVQVDLATDKNQAKLQVTLNADQVKELKNKNASIKLNKGDVEVTIPATNLISDEEVTVTIEKYKKYEGAISSVYDFTINQGESTIDQFTAPVTLTFEVDQRKVNNQENVKVYYYNEEKNQWELIGGEYANGKVTAQTNHFSIYAVFEKEVETDAVTEETGNDKEPESQLPNTATSTFNYLAIGLLVLLLGVIFIAVPRMNRKKY